MRTLDGLIRRQESRSLYDAYLRRVDAEAVLNHYGMNNASYKGDEVIHSCLIDQVDPHHQNGDANPSASCNLEKKVYNCHGYGGGDIFWLIAKMEGKEEFHEIVPLLSQFLEGNTQDTETFMEELTQYFNTGGYSEEATPHYHERVLRIWAKYHPYLKDRGVSMEAAEELQLGYDETGVRITIPHWWQGDLVGWQRRSLSDPRWPQTPPEPRYNDKREIVSYAMPPKYKNSTGFPKHHTVYHYDAVMADKIDDVLVVESPMSVARALSLGHRNVLSTFGAKVGDEQIRALAKFDRVTVWFDDDPAGRRGAYKLMDGLYRQTKTFHIEPEVGRDLADVADEQELSRILKSSEPAVLALAPLEERYGRGNKKYGSSRPRVHRR